MISNQMTTTIEKKLWFLVSAAVSLLVLAACGAAEPAAAADQVVLQLKWLHNPQFAGFYIAHEKGYYAEENIEVTLEAGGSKVDIIDTVVSGKAQFGLYQGNRLLNARAEGQPVTAIATIFQVNPSVYFSLAETGIEEPADLAGKRIAYSADRDFTLPAVLQSVGLSTEDVEAYPIDYDVTPLLEGEADVWSGYLINEVVSLREQGHEVNFILPDDYGVHVYSDVLFTTEAQIEQNPELVQRFVRATLKGWNYALAHPDEAITATAKFEPSLDIAHSNRVMQAMIPLIDSGQIPIGMMDETVWQSTQNMMLENDLISAPLDLTAMYTNEFVEKGR